MEPDVSICVATCERRAGLARLLESLAALEIPTACRVEVLVVDNAPGSGAAAGLRERSLPGLALRWLEEPQRNIARARNRAVDAARGRWLAFVDDDEVAEPGWLAAYWAAQREAAPDGAAPDGWFGPVLPRLERIVTPWLAPEGFYARPRHATGCAVPAAELRTGNAFVRRSRLGDRRFDPAFGLSGGSDLELFARLQAEGARFAWCDEARVTEIVPPERHRLSWLSRRAFRGGVVTTRLARRARGRAALARGLPRALLGLLGCATWLPAALVAGRAPAARTWLRLCIQAGHLWAFAGGDYREYRASPAGTPCR